MHVDERNQPEDESNPTEPIVLKPEDLPNDSPSLQITPEEATVPPAIVITPEELPTLLPESSPQPIVIGPEDLAEKYLDAEKPPTCPVCGDVLDMLSPAPERPIVVCAKSKTPHHLECWQAMGNMCSDLGCGCTKYHRYKPKAK